MNVIEAPSPNFDPRTVPPSILVLHYTGMQSGQEAIDRLRGSDFAKDWLGPRFVEAFTATRECQHDEFRRRVPDVELERFFDLG